MKDYKVYYKNAMVYITNVPQSNKNFPKVLNQPAEIDSFLQNPDLLFTDNFTENILLLTNDTELAMEQLKTSLKLVLAAGGVVTNEHDEILLIYRRGFWDMAKGKLEKGEQIEACAVREVEEETGVKIKNADTVVTHTYHAYILKGKRSLKQTSWYNMISYPGQTTLIPQVEEDIQDVRWVKKTDLLQYKDTCHLLIWDLLSPYIIA